MIENLKQKAEVLAETKLQETKASLKAVLLKELRDELLVEETSDGVVVSGRHLGTEITENHSLRDVAFLMRGVR